jgi:hypothetical protein
VPNSVVPSVEALCIHEVQPMHAFGEVLACALDDEVEVIVEHAVRVEKPAEALLGVVEPADDRVPVVVVVDDRLPRDAAHCDVNGGVRRKQ